MRSCQLYEVSQLSVIYNCATLVTRNKGTPGPSPDSASAGAVASDGGGGGGTTLIIVDFTKYSGGASAPLHPGPSAACSVCFANRVHNPRHHCWNGAPAVHPLLCSLGRSFDPSVDRQTLDGSATLKVPRTVPSCVHTTELEEGKIGGGQEPSLRGQTAGAHTPTDCSNDQCTPWRVRPWQRRQTLHSQCAVSRIVCAAGTRN